MNEAKKNSYLLLSCTDEWYKQLSPAELQKLIAANRAWVKRLFAEGKARPGVALERTGATIQGKTKRVVLDGPFAESKEAIGGTLVLDVATIEEAIAIAKECPSLSYSTTTMEVRPISDECPLEARASELAREKTLAAATV